MNVPPAPAGPVAGPAPGLNAGWNGWRVVDAALNQPASLTRRFKDAQEAGLNVLRFFLGDDERSPVLQTAPGGVGWCLPLLPLPRLAAQPHPLLPDCGAYLPPLPGLHIATACPAGVFDERVAQAVDFVLAESAAHSIKLTPVLLNLWKRNNGVPQFEEWCACLLLALLPDPRSTARRDSRLASCCRPCSRCGTASTSRQPRPGGGSLDAQERLQTPYDWLVSPKCRDQVGEGRAGRALVVRPLRRPPGAAFTASIVPFFHPG